VEKAEGAKEKRDPLSLRSFGDDERNAKTERGPAFNAGPDRLGKQI
jgi:hypothetical protein